MDAPRPVILSIAGADPSSGAGLQADLCTGVALGVHVCTVLTAWTVQNTQGVQRVVVLDPADTRQQLEQILADFTIAAIKIGLIGSVAMARMLVELLSPLALPIILDPLWRAGAGTELADAPLFRVLRQELLPLVLIATPNGPEAALLGESRDLDQAASRLSLPWLLISGGHGTQALLDNRLYRQGRLYERYPQERLAGQYHGTGCTLSTAIAAGIALGKEVPAAVAAALDFTHQAVRAAESLGRGQRILQYGATRPC